MTPGEELLLNSRTVTLASPEVRILEILAEAISELPRKHRTFLQSRLLSALRRGKVEPMSTSAERQHDGRSAQSVLQRRDHAAHGN
jgi:hypothetical protein